MNALFTDPLVHALGWTLLQFCWQGAVVAALLWCVLALVPVRVPPARYAAASLALAMMVALPLGTFVRLAAAEIRASRELRALPIVMQPAFVVNAGAGSAQEPLQLRVEQALDASVPWLPAVWLAGVVVFLARLNLGLIVARRMRSAVSEPVEDGLREALARLSARMGVRRAVRLVQSAMVQAPTVIGWLRPVVLVPVGCLTGLSPAQMEAILAHELAHIRRHDYLVSVMQSVVEALLFYHPAVWWVSKQMRRERESCCDDVAVRLSGDRVAYARALSWLEEHRAATPEFVLGANGGVLTMRIKRLLGYGESPVVSRSIAATLLVGASVLAGSYLVTVARAEARAMTVKSSEVALEATPPLQGLIAEERPLSLAASMTKSPAFDPTGRNIRSIDYCCLNSVSLHEMDARFALEHVDLKPETPYDPMVVARAVVVLREMLAERGRPTAIVTPVTRTISPGAIAVAFRIKEGPKGTPGKLVSYEQGAAGDSSGAAPLGVGSLSPLYRNWVHEDVLWIITPQERAAFLRLTSDQERDAFIQQFWDRRDPPGSPRGAFKDEHYARIAYSNERFAGNSQVGWRTDRGRVYIVYGKADFIDAHPSGGDGMGGYPYEVWHYRHIEGVGDSVNVAFVDTCKCGEYHYTIDRAGQPALGRMLNGQLGRVVPVATPADLKIAAAFAGAPLQSASQAGAEAKPMDGDGAIAGTIVDPTGALVPRAQIRVVNTDTGQARMTQVTGNDGRYAAPRLAPGSYNVEVEAKGFQRMLQENVQVAAKQQTELNMKLSVGAENTTISVTGAPVAAAPPPVIKVPAAKPSGPQRISSGTMVGLLISKVDPVYPDEAKAARVQGVVVLRAVIAKDGTIKKLTYISGPPPLVVSAVEAVQQWKYKPYLLNGEPTEVETTISVNYTFEGSTEQEEQPGGQKNMSSVPRRIGGGVSAPTLIYEVEPEFSPEAKKAKVGGNVLVNLIVDAKGLPENVHVLRRFGESDAAEADPKVTKARRAVAQGMDEQAIAAVRQYKFRPAEENGQPVPVDLNVEVNFKIF